MGLKIREYLRKASLNPKFTASYNKKYTTVLFYAVFVDDSKTTTT